MHATTKNCTVRKKTLAFYAAMRYTNGRIPAGVMELVDVVDSKSTAGDSVPVRVRSPAPDRKNPNLFLNEETDSDFLFFGRFSICSA